MQSTSKRPTDSLALLNCMSKPLIGKVLIASSCSRSVRRSNCQDEHPPIELAEDGDVHSMEQLAECLLSDPDGDRATEGERWLRIAAERGSPTARITLGVLLLQGKSLRGSPEQGRRLLHEEAINGSQLAQLRLGVRSLSGKQGQADREEAFRWFHRLGATKPDDLSNLGHYLYLKSLGASKLQAQDLAEEAALLFKEAVRQGHRGAELNLAYMLRRGEISGDDSLSLDALLAEHLKKRNAHALVNQVLRLAAGFDCTSDWQTADRLISEIEPAESVLLWWFGRSEQGDPEGHLVTGWLVRHQLVVDPDGRGLDERMNNARRGGWIVPQWMSCVAKRKTGGS
jgi:TPR repeat protein